ncbi:MAG TPA: hypothetical protein VF988_12020 [Verrucomicrobiae bacterium]
MKIRQIFRFVPHIVVLSFWLGPIPTLQATVTVALGENFTGSSLYTNSQALPPDSNGAIGPGRFMEFVNGTVAVYNRTNGAQVQRKSDLIFWANAGVVLASSQAVSDPRVIYDPQTQRWFAIQVDLDGNATDPTTEANDFLLAVSTSSNPAGAWKGFLIPSDPDNGYFADFPTLGIDSNAVYIGGDYYRASVPMGTGLLSIPKADLVAATPTVASQHWFGVMNYGQRGEVLQPAICFDGSASGNLIAVGDIGNDSNPHSNVVCFAEQNAGSVSPSLTGSTFLNVLPYQVPDDPNLGYPSFAALQPDGTTTLLANDARFAAKVYAVNGVLYAVHNTLVNGRIAIRWYDIRAADYLLLEQGTIADPNLDLFFPSIAANQYGVVVIGCNASGLATPVSSYAYVGEIQNGVTTFTAPLVLKTGAGSYHDVNEIMAQLLGDPVSPSRWGDYSATSVDPADPTHFWTIQAFPSYVDPDTGGVWSTQITEIIATTAPTLNLAATGTNVVVSWPNYASGYQLQSTTNLFAANSWLPVTTGISTNGLSISVQIIKTGQARYFRLSQ